MLFVHDKKGTAIKKFKMLNRSLIIVAILVVCGSFLMTATGQSDGGASSSTLHKTLAKVNSVAEKVPKGMKVLTDRIEVQLEDPPAHVPSGSNVVSSAARGAGRLAGNVTLEAARFAGTVTKGAVNLARRVTSAAVNTVKQSARRIANGRSSQSAPAKEASSESSANSPNELVNNEAN